MAIVPLLMRPISAPETFAIVDEWKLPERVNGQLINPAPPVVNWFKLAQVMVNVLVLTLSLPADAFAVASESVSAAVKPASRSLL